MFEKIAMHWDFITWLFAVVYMLALIKLITTSIKVLPFVTRHMYWIAMSIDI